MIETKRHLREIIETKSKQISSRDKLIQEYRDEHKALYNENKELRFDNEELSELVQRIKKLAESNNYNNEKNILNKIKELVSDFDSNY